MSALVGEKKRLFASRVGVTDLLFICDDNGEGKERVEGRENRVRREKVSARGETFFRAFRVWAYRVSPTFG